MFEIKQFGEIYLHLNTANGRGYVGQTTQGAETRWKEQVRHARLLSCADYKYPLSRAIRKYGAAGFNHQILSDAQSKAELNNLERVWIILLGTRKPNGYNLAKGGEGNPGLKHTDAAKEKIAAGHRGRPLSAEHRAALSLAGKGNPKHGGGVPKGHVWSAERNEKLRQAITGKKRPDLTARNLKRWVDFRATKAVQHGA